MKENNSHKNCSKCGAEFECKSYTGNCWCEGYELTTEQLNFLKENYDNCLCQTCIVQLADEAKLNL